MQNSDGLYDKEISRYYPGMFVILLDQSDSMGDVARTDDNGKKYTKADLVTHRVNHLIQQMIYSLMDRDGKCKNSIYLSILGYNDKVTSLLPKKIMGITEIEEMPNKEIVVIDKKPNLRLGSVLEKKKTQRIWISPEHGRSTEMAQAFREGESVVKEWLDGEPGYIWPDEPEKGKQRPRQSCFPPIVIHITDAIDTGHENPLTVAREIQQLGTREGNVLIFNCHFTTETNSSRVIFPKNLSDLSKVKDAEYAETLFQMSSILPNILRENAQKIMKNSIASGSRCFVYNADLDVLVNFLNIGTKGMGDAR